MTKPIPYILGACLLFFTGFTTPTKIVTGNANKSMRGFPSVTSVSRADLNPTNAVSVDFTVVFSEDVSPVVMGDFSVTNSTVTGASVTGVSGTGFTYTVTVSTGTGNGMVQLDVDDGDNTILSVSTSDPLTPSAYTAGEVYTIDKSPPTVVISSDDADALVKNTDVVNITATFTDANAIDETSVPKITIGALVTAVDMAKTSNTVWTYQWTVAGAADIAHAVSITATDVAGNASAAPTGQTSFTGDNTNPTVVISSDDADALVKNTDVVNITATFTDANAIDETSVPKITIGALVTAVDMAKTSNTVWTYQWTVAGAADIAHAISIAATDVAGNASAAPTGQTSFTGDNTSPTIVISSDDGDAIVANTDVVNITATFTDANAIDETSVPKITIGALVTAVDMAKTSNTVWTYQWTVAGAADIAHAISITATDIAGNASAAPTGQSSFTGDNSSPTVVISSDDADAIVANTDVVNITATFTDASAIDETSVPKITIGALVTAVDMAKTSNTIWTYQWTVAGAADIAHAVSITATDVAGNVSAAPSGQSSFTGDNTSPTVVISSDDADALVKNTDVVNITATFTDSNAIDETSVPKITIGTLVTAVDMAKTSNTVWTFQWTVAGAADIAHAISITATDVAGNASAAPTGQTSFTGDNTNPTVVISSDDADALVKNTDVVNITATFTDANAIDETSVPKITIGALITAVDMAKTSNTVWTYQWTVAGAADIAHAVSITATDVAGNAPAAPTGQTSFTGDNTSPTVVISSDDGDALVKDTDVVNIAATFTDASAIDETSVPKITIGALITAVDMAKTSNTVWTYQWTVAGAGDGNHSISITAADVAGNSAGAHSGQTSFESDNSGPTVVISSDDGDQLVKNGNTVEITATFSDANSIDETSAPEISIGVLETNAAMAKTSNTVWTYTWNVAVAGDIAHAITITATDELFNPVGTHSGETSFTADNTAPVIASPVTSDATAAGVLGIGGTIIFTADITGPNQPGLTVVSDTYNGQPLTWATSDGGDTYEATYTIIEGESDQPVALQVSNVQATDIVGNIGIAVNGTLVAKTIDATRPTLGPIQYWVSGSLSNDNRAYLKTQVSEPINLSHGDQITMDTDDGNNTSGPGFTVYKSGSDDKSAFLGTGSPWPSGYYNVYLNNGATDRGIVSTRMLLMEAAGNAHWDGVGTLDVDYRAGGNIVDLAGNEMANFSNVGVTDGDAVAPSIASTLVLSPNGVSAETIVFTMDEILDLAENADVIGFTVSTGTIASAKYTGFETTKTITLTRGTGFWDNTVTVNYATNGTTSNVKDAAGNEMANFSLAPVVYENIPPAITVLTVSSNNATTSTFAKNGDEVTIAFTTDDGLDQATIALTNIQIGGVPFAPTVTYATVGTNQYTAKFNVTTGNGAITFDLAFEDVAGNLSATFDETDITSGSSVTVDNIVPSTPTLALNNGDDTGQFDTDDLTNQTTGLTIEGVKETNTSIELFGPGSLGTVSINGSTSWSIDISLAEAIHNLTVTATDAAGNQTSSGTFQMEVDVTAPQATGATLFLIGVNVSDDPAELDTLVVSFDEPLGHVDAELLSYVDNGGVGAEVDDPNTDDIDEDACDCSQDNDQDVTKAEYRAADNKVLLTASPDSWPRWDHGTESENDETASGFYYVQVGGTNGGGGIFDIAGNELQALGATDTNGATPFGWVFDLELVNGDANPPTIASGVSFRSNGTNPEHLIFKTSEPINLDDGDAITNLGSFGVSAGAVGSAYWDEATNSIVVVSALDGQWNSSTTLQFTTGGGTNIQDGGANELDSFGPSLPTLSSVTIASLDNTRATDRATTGNTVSIAITTNVNINTPSVLIDENAAVVTGAGTSWTATRLMQAGDTEDTIQFQIDAVETASTLPTLDTLTSNGSFVIYDETAPTLSAITIVSSYGTDITEAKDGATITIDFTADEDLFFNASLPSVTMIGRAATVVQNGGADQHQASIVVDDLVDTEGPVSFSISYEDAAGISGVAQTQANITAGSNVNVDFSPYNVNAITAVTGFNAWSNKGVTFISPTTDVVFKVEFDEQVFSLTTSDFNLVVSAVPGPPVGSITSVDFGADTTVTVTLTGGTGALGLEFNDGNNSVLDKAGNISASTFSQSDVFQIVHPEPSHHVSGQALGTVTTTTFQVTWVEEAAPTQAPTHYLAVLKDGSVSYPTIADGDNLLVDTDDTDLSDNIMSLNLPVGSTSATFTGLNSGTGYSIRIYPYTLSANNTSDNVNFKTDATIPSISGTTQVGSVGTIVLATTADATISSLVNLQGDAAANINFEFTILDDGVTPAVDNANTRLSEIIILKGSANNVLELADWTQVIETGGASLSDGTTTVLGTVNATDITFTGLASTNTGDFGFIDDNTSKTYTLRIWLKPDPDGILEETIDNKIFEFRVEGALGMSFSYNETGQQSSKVEITEAVESGDTNNQIDVVSTQLDFTIQPTASNPVLVNLITPPVVRARDVNGNTDLDYNETLTVTNSSSLPMVNQPLSAVSGVFDFSLLNFQYTDDGDGAVGNGTLAVYDGTDPDGGAVPGPLTDAASSAVTVSYSDDTQILPSAVLTEPASISSLLNDQISELDVFDFVIQDDVSPTLNDGAATRISQIVIAQNTTDNDAEIADWTKIIAGATLRDDQGNSLTILNGSPEITATTMVFNSNPGTLGLVSDDDDNLFTLSIWLLSSLDPAIADVVDNKKLAFEISEAEITLEPNATGPNSSTLSTSTTNSGAATNAVDVVTTDIEFVISPSVQPDAVANYDANLPTSPEATARDANNNRDYDYAGTINVTNADGLAVSNNTVNISNGVVSLDPGFQFNVGGVNGANGTITFTDAGTPSIAATTSPVEVRYSGSSDIVRNAGFVGGGYPSNIVYIDFQGTDITDNSNSTILEGFTIRDGGVTMDDTDGTGTTITEITISIENRFNLRQLALYDAAGTTELATSGTNEQTVISGTVTFDGLNILAPDDGSLDFTIRASFKDNGVVDNDSIAFTITNVVGGLTGSQFDQPDGGGAKSVHTLDENRIEVTATDLDFTTDIPGVDMVSTYTDISPTLVVEARDLFDNTDKDYVSALSGISNTFGPTLVTQNDPSGNFAEGVFTFNTDFQFITDGLAGELEASAPGLNDATSITFNVAAAQESTVELNAPTSGTIPYILYPDAALNPTNTANSFELAQLALIDGGNVVGLDVDGAATILQDMTFDISNHTNLQTVGIYEGTNLVQEQAASATMTFNGLNISTPDEGTTIFSIRASFNTDSLNVFDNEEIHITITSVTNGGGSKFANANGANDLDVNVTTETDADANLIDVVATQIVFSTASNALEGINIPLVVEPEIRALDANMVRDENHDFAGAISTLEAGISTANINFIDGVQKFTGFDYTSTGDGQISVSSNSLNVIGVGVDVIHTTLTNLDIGGGSDVTNNGIDPSTNIGAGSVNRAILGFDITSVQNTLNEPGLSQLTFRFNNVSQPISEIFNKFRLFRSTNSEFEIFVDTNIQTQNAGFDFVTFTGLSEIITSDPSDRHYFLVVDIDVTANKFTEKITPTLTTSGEINGDVILSSGSALTNSPLLGVNIIQGREYGFADFNAPLVISQTPSLDPVNINFPQNSQISIEFNESVRPAISANGGIIRIYQTSDNALVETLIYSSVSGDSATYFFTPTALISDTFYYILIEGDAFTDQSDNFYAGISGIGTWKFRTSDIIPPMFYPIGDPDLEPEILNITDVGFDVRVAIDEPGVIYFLVVDPTQIGGTDPQPTANEIINNSYGVVGASVWQDSVLVVKGDEYHYKVFFDSNVFGPQSTDFGLYMVARDNSVPSNVQLDGDIIYLQDTYGPELPDDVNVVSNPNGEQEEICIGNPQVLLTPLQLIEGSDSDNAPGTDLKMSLIISGNFIFNVNAVADTVIGYGNMIVTDYSYGNDGLLDITYDIVGTDQRDKMVISGLELLSTGTVGDAGTLQRFGGTAFPTIPDYTVLAEMTTSQIAPIDFFTSLGTFTVGNNEPKFALIPDPANPLVDLGINIFSATTGAGLEGDTVFTASAQLGTHTLTMTHTDEIGCVAELSKDYFLFDSNNAIGDLSQLYCTDEPDAVIRLTARLPDFLLVDLVVERDTIAFNLVDVDSSLIIDNGDYLFRPSWFNSTAYYNLFANNQGGLIGELKFTGIYQNQQDLTVFTTLEQFVEIYIPPTNEMTIDGVSVDSDPLTQNLINFCDINEGILLEGSPKPATGVSEGFFAIEWEWVESTSGNSLSSGNVTNVTGLTDNKQGSAIINPQQIADSLGLGEFKVKYIFTNLNSGCNDVITQLIRVNPKPIANYSLGTLCEDTPLEFTNLSGFTIGLDSLNSVIPSLKEWIWSFNDENSAGTNDDFLINLDSGDVFFEAAHSFSDPGVYNVELTVTDEFGCSDSFGELSGEEIIIGGLPQVGFDFAGTDIADTMVFHSTSAVFSNATLQHSVDSLTWVFGDGNISTSSNNILLQDESTPAFNNYSNPDVYSVTLIAESTVGCESSLTQSIVVLDRDNALGGLGTYFQDFSTTNNNWIAVGEPGDTTTSWAVGSSTKANYIDDGHGNAWITDLIDSYEQDGGERSYVHSPSFDISSLSRPMISFDHFRDLDNTDGVILEVSTDSLNIMDPNKIWATIGSAQNSGEEWYNELSIPAAPGNNPNRIGWTDTSGIWLESKHALSTSYPDPTNVVFRFGFASLDSSVSNGGAGFAFDDVRIGNRTRTVLLEHFENIYTEGSNTPLDFINNDFMASGTELVRIQYRMGYPDADPYNAANTSGPATRALYYGVTEIPDARLDGTPDSGGDTDFEGWGQNAFNLRSLNISQIDLSLNVQSINRKLEATLDVVSPNEDIGSSMTVHLAVVENTTDGYILRKMLPNAAGTIVETGLVSAVVQTFTETWGITNIEENNFDQIAVVGFVQDNATKQVYQSVLATPANTVDLVLATIDDLAANRVALYPNPATSHATLLLESVMSAEVEIKVFDPFGRLVHEAIIPAGEDRHVFNVKPLPKGIYLIQLHQDDIPILQKKMAIVHK